MNFVDFLLDECLSSPDKLFLLGKEELSYEKLIFEVNSLSKYLSNLGENNNIILSSPNSIFFIISYLAIIKSGNICIPVDSSISYDNFNHIISESQPKLLFLSRYSKIQLKSELEYSIINEDFIHELFKNGRYCQWRTDHFSSERIAEIIYTSGSTGKPKGVMLSHDNLIANTTSITEYLKLTSFDRVLVVLPFYYCYGLSLLHTHLRCNGSIVINSPFIFLGGVINDLSNYKCTGFAGVPSHYQILLRKTNTFKTSHFPSLRYVTQAGGKLHDVFISEFVNAFPDVDFYVMYGQTEATARLSFLSPDLVLSKIGSVGKGIPGVSLRVVNEKFEDILPGETGEIIAMGKNLMAGYYKDLLLTQQSFNQGWLKTGDLATIDEDGYIYLIARSKEIIKVRGKRVSPKEIESVIMEIRGVIDCSIESFYDELQGEALEAQIVINEEYRGVITKELIQQLCSKQLEAYKVPSKVTFLSNLKISGSGKKIKS